MGLIMTPLSPRNLIIILISTILLVSFFTWFLIFREHAKISTPLAKVDKPIIQESPDVIRVRQIKLIQRFTDTAVRHGFFLPLPDNNLDIVFGSDAISFQGIIPVSFYKSIGLGPQADPQTGEGYFYALSADRSTYQIMALLDNKELSNNTFGDILAYVRGTGKNLFFLDHDNLPLVTKKINPGKLDISDLATLKKIGLDSPHSCKDIYNYSFITPKSGVYSIDIEGQTTKVFCDMSIDGGGWTLFYANKSRLNSSTPIKTYVDMRNSLGDNSVTDLSDYENPNLAGLLDFYHFTKGGSKEILIKNRNGDMKKWFKVSFSNPAILEWALGSSVIGGLSSGCFDLPRRGTWDIINNDKKISYYNLNQIIGGNSWSISSSKTPCNGYQKIIGFGVEFYPGNELRYFIR